MLDFRNGEMAALRSPVSVVMPCFNASRTLETAIASALGQIDCHVDVIVVDDGSSDGSPELVRELAQTDPRVRLIQQANSGPSAARNRGIAAAAGRVIAFLDADDLWLPDHLQRHLAELARDPGLGLSFSATTLIDRFGQPTGEVTPPWTRNLEPVDLLAGNPTSTCSTLVFRREVFEAAGPLRVDMHHAEDQEWLFRVARTSWKVRGISERTVQYRTSPSGLSADTDCMRVGWLRFMELAQELEPRLVETHGARATAMISLYWAQRALRTGQPIHVARRHLSNALTASPATAAASSLRTLAIAGGCVAPKLVGQIISQARRLRRA